MEGYVPDFDATIVSRLLNAGGRIVGKTNMDDMAATGNGHSSAFGPTLNPHDDEYLAGGSSGGSAIAVATGDADVTIGGDQGGSIRVPAAWTGVVGLKPTYGLVPYTGIVGLDNMVDHAGPLAKDVRTVARTLTVLAGKDPKDPRQPDSVPVDDYEASLDGVVDGLSIGVVQEGFNWPQSESEVNSSVRGGLDDLEDLGASVEEVSIPMHRDAEDIYAVVLSEAYVPLYQSEGLGWSSKGWHDTSWADAFGKFRRAQGGDLPPSVKVTLLLGAYVSDQYHSKYYAEGMNLVTELTDIYDDILATYDLLAMPTSPHNPYKYVPDQTRAEFLDDAWTMNANTCPFNLTGHPAISVPVEPEGELPVGLMLVGSEFDDSTVLNAANALEM